VTLTQCIESFTWLDVSNRSRDLMYRIVPVTRCIESFTWLYVSNRSRDSMYRIVHVACYRKPLSTLIRKHEPQTYYSTIPFSLYPQPGSSQTPSEFEMGLQQVNNSCLVESVLNEVGSLHTPT
jgi:hypothetical protein